MLVALFAGSAARQIQWQGDQHARLIAALSAHVVVALDHVTPAERRNVRGTLLCSLVQGSADQSQDGGRESSPPYWS